MLIFQDSVAHLLPALVLVTSLISEGLNLYLLTKFRWVISIHGWFILLYFQFTKTTGRHQNSTSGSQSAYMCRSGMMPSVIPPSFVNLSIHAEVISIYQISNMATAAILDRTTALPDYARSQIDGPNISIKFPVDWLIEICPSCNFEVYA